MSDDHDVLDSTIDSEDYNASNEEEEDDFISDDSKEGSSFTGREEDLCLLHMHASIV